MPKRSFYARDNAAKTDVPMTDHANVPCKLLPAPSTASGGTLPPVEEIEFEMEGGARQELSGLTHYQYGRRSNVGICPPRIAAAESRR